MPQDADTLVNQTGLQNILQICHLDITQEFFASVPGIRTRYITDTVRCCRVAVEEALVY